MKNKLLNILIIITLQNVLISQSLSSGGWLTLIKCNDNSVRSFGLNTFGELGDGTTIQKYNPVQVIGLSNIASVSAGEYHSLFLSNDSSVWSCGQNQAGQLGDGTINNKSIATQIPNLSSIVSISAGSGHSLFLKRDGTVWGCGSNYDGQLGLGTSTLNYTSPIQIPALTNIVAISCGYAFSLFLKDDGTVLGCGRNFSGELGVGSNTNSVRSPIQIPSINGIIKISAGQDFSLFLKNDGNVFACGSNASGCLGDGTGIKKVNPIQITALNNVTDISAGAAHSLFLKNDGTVRASGANSGALGDGTLPQKLSPVNVILLNGITNISAGQNRSYFLKNNGTVWVCGKNNNGTLGVGPITQQYYTTAIQMSGLCIVNNLNEHFLSNHTFKVFPNPTNEIINISFNQINSNISYSKIKIFDFTGRLVKELFDFKEINVKDLLPGIYEIIIEIQNTNYYYSKFIKE